MANVIINPQTDEIQQIKLPGQNTSYYFKDDAARTALGNVQVSLTNDYTSTQQVLELISPSASDTFQVAISKLHAGLVADELILQAGLNDLNKRSFDDTLKIVNNAESSAIDSINNGVYVLQYVTQSGEGDNITETLNSLAILIQAGIHQYLYKDGKISQRTKTNNVWESWAEMSPQLKTVNNESLVGTGNIVVSGLPLVSSADNGKILMVVNGQWQLVSPSVLYSGSGVPNNSNGNNGDLYMQTD